VFWCFKSIRFYLCRFEVCEFGFELVFMFQEFRIQEFMCSGVSRVSGFIYVGLKYVSLGLSV